MSDPDVQTRIKCSGIAHAKSLEGETNEPRRAALGIFFELGEVRCRVVFEVGFAHIDQPIEVVAGESQLADNGGERLHHGMVADQSAFKSSGDVFAPPL